MALSRIESVLPQVLSPEWVTAPGMSKSLMGSRQTHMQDMTFTQKVTVRNCADTSHRGCHHIYLIFFILSHVPSFVLILNALCSCHSLICISFMSKTLKLCFPSLA